MAKETISGSFYCVTIPDWVQWPSWRINQTSWRINYDVLLSRHTHAYWIAFIFIRKTITSMPHHEYFVSFYFKIINVLTFEIIDKLMTFYSLCEIYAQSVRSICIRRAFDTHIFGIYLWIDQSIRTYLTWSWFRFYVSHHFQLCATKKNWIEGSEHTEYDCDIWGNTCISVCYIQPGNRILFQNLLKCLNPI